jgi:hypothetical protein
MPPSFFAQPLHITDRDVILQLIPDSDALCLSQEQLASDLKQRGQRIRTQRSRDSEESVYTERHVQRRALMWIKPCGRTQGGMSGQLQLTGRLSSPCLCSLTSFHGPLVSFASAGSGHIGSLRLAEGDAASSLSQL